MDLFLRFRNRSIQRCAAASSSCELGVVGRRYSVCCCALASTLSTASSSIHPQVHRVPLLQLLVQPCVPVHALLVELQIRDLHLHIRPRLFCTLRCQSSNPSRGVKWNNYPYHSQELRDIVLQKHNSDNDCWRNSVRLHNVNFRDGACPFRNRHAVAICHGVVLISLPRTKTARK